MKAITAPINGNSSREVIVNLHDTLQMCLDRGVILGNDPNARQSLSQALRPERERQSYGRATVRALSIFQRERNLQQSEAVDEPTANALNALLTEWGVLDQPVPRWSCVVSGLVRREDGQPLRGQRVRVVHEAPAGSLRLGEDSSDREGRYTIRYETAAGGGWHQPALSPSSTDGKPLRDSEVIRGAKPLEIMDLIVPGADLNRTGCRARSPAASAPALAVCVSSSWTKGSAAMCSSRNPPPTTRRFPGNLRRRRLRRRGKAQPDLQARVFAGDPFLGASDVHYNASQDETLNVLLDDKAASALRSEYEVLTSALASQFKGKLGDLKETDEQQDITYLANKTGWDARAVALAALADQFSARTADASGDSGDSAGIFLCALPRRAARERGHALSHRCQDAGSRVEESGGAGRDTQGLSRPDPESD